MTRPMTVASRIRRAAAGKALILLALFGIGTPWTWIGAIPLMAGVTGWCPFQALYSVLSTKRDASCP